MKEPKKPTDYERVAQAIEYLEEWWRERPSLGEVAQVVGLSEHHFQRMFRRWVGVSPKQFLQFLTLDHARSLVRRSTSLLEASYDLGFSGPSRLHDLFVTVEAMTPGEFKRGGAGLAIEHGVHDSPFGPCRIGQTSRGICWLSFDEPGAEDGVEAMHQSWPKARLVDGGRQTARTVERIFDGEVECDPLRLLVGGTNFQLKVWEALIRIPPGEAVAYGDIAAAIGAPTASRAVGSAVGCNRISWLIPCHRVVHRLGRVGSYRWGWTRKRAMLGWEAARTSR